MKKKLNLNLIACIIAACAGLAVTLPTSMLDGLLLLSIVLGLNRNLQALQVFIWSHALRSILLFGHLKDPTTGTALWLGKVLTTISSIHWLGLIIAFVVLIALGKRATKMGLVALAVTLGSSVVVGVNYHNMSRAGAIHSYATLALGLCFIVALGNVRKDASEDH